MTTSPQERTRLEGPSPSVPRRGEEGAQEEAPAAQPQLLLHGRGVPRMLQNHQSLAPLKR